MKLSVDADLRFSVDVPGARRVNGHLTGSGTDLELRVDDSFVFAGRRDAGAIRGLADGLAERGLTITVIDPSGPLVTLDLRRFYLRDLTFTGSTVTPPGVIAALVRHLEAGALRPVLAATYPLKDLPAAQTAFMAKTHTGNTVVIP